MLKNSTIIKIEINGFNRRTQTEYPAATVQYLAEYYELISGLVSRQRWRIVKSMGDCVLVAAHDNTGVEDIVSLYEAIDNRFDVSFHYRECEFEEVEFSFDQYSCLDTIGKDINNLFLNDASTIVLG